MNHTQNYQLSQWESTDRILMSDFNSDNSKIDGLLKLRNCQVYLTSYVGTGSGDKTLTFPGKPIFVTVMGGQHTWLCTVNGSPETYLRSDAIACGVSRATWTENSLTWTEHPSGGELYANAQGSTYYVAAILEVD